MLAIIAVLVALVVTGSCAPNTRCSKPTECVRTGGLPPKNAVRFDNKSFKLYLTWQSDSDRAAAALLLHLLEAFDYCRLVLCQASGPCALQRKLGTKSGGFIMGLEKDGGKCNNFRALDSPGIAPVTVRPHVRLAAAARNDISCLATTVSRVYNETALLETCGFHIPVPYYVLDGYNDNMFQFNSSRRNCTRAELDELVKSSNESFLFLDTELWTNEPLVDVVNAAFPSYEHSTEATLNFDYRLRQSAPDILEALRRHAVNASDLRELLNIEANVSIHNPNLSLSELAVRAAAVWAQDNEARFKRAMEPFQRKMQYYKAVVYLCRGEHNHSHDTYRFLDEIQVALKIRTHIIHEYIEIDLEKAQIDCLVPFSLRDKLDERMRSSMEYRVMGVVAAGAGVPDVSQSSYNLPMVAYDAQPGTENTLASGARAEDLASALLHAMGECKWRRVALLSESTPTSTRVAEVLRSGLKSWAEEQLPQNASQLELQEMLVGLHSRGARVFVVNASGNRVRTLLAAAAAALLPGCAWVAREWPGPGVPPLPLLALRLAEDTDELGLRTPAPSWRPPYEVPLSDAITTLYLTFARMLSKHREVRNDIQGNETVDFNWESLTPNEKDNLVYYKREGMTRAAVRLPRLRLERWSAPSDSAPHYRDANASGCHAPEPLVRDGYQHCEIKDGSAIDSRCYDTLVAFGVPALLLAVMLLGHGGAALRRQARARRLERRRHERAEAVASLLMRQKEAVPTLLSWLVEREDVRLLRELGAGRFGRVWLAALADTYVAAKAPHEGCAPAEEGELLREAATLAPLQHDHVVRLVGVCLSEGPPLVLTEPAFFGDLLEYMRARRPLAMSASPPDRDTEAEAETETEEEHVSAPALTRLAREAALALAYLATCRLVHCDVRAANCLVDARRSLKLADFGMARATSGARLGATGAVAAGDGEYATQRRALFPVLWMAPESLELGVFSHASDVWALGVLALEMVTLGARPFGSLEARAAVRMVVEGGHARLPATSSAQTRWLARACWRREAAARPTAMDLAAWLQRHPSALEPVLCRIADAGAEDGDSGFAEPPDCAPYLDPS